MLVLAMMSVPVWSSDGANTDTDDLVILAGGHGHGGRDSGGHGHGGRDSGRNGGVCPWRNS